MIPNYKVIIDKTSSFLSKPLPSFLITVIITYSCTRNHFIANLFFCVIFFSMAALLLLLFYQSLSRIRLNSQLTRKKVLSVTPVLATTVSKATATVVEAGAGRLAVALASATGRQVGVGVGVATTGYFGLDAMSNDNLTHAAEIRASHHYKEASDYETEGRPARAALSRALGDDVTIRETQRVFGGTAIRNIHDSVSEYFKSEAETEADQLEKNRMQHLQDEATYEDQIRRRRSETEERLEVESNVMFESQRQKHSYQKGEIDYNQSREEEFKKRHVGNTREELQEDWENTPLVEKTRTHFNNVADSVNNSEVGREVVGGLARAGARTVNNWVVDRIQRVELHFFNVEKPVPPVNSSFKDNVSQKTETENNIDQNETLIPAYREEENRENPAQPASLRRAEPISKAFLEERDRHFEKQASEDVKNLIKNLKQSSKKT